MDPLPPKRAHRKQRPDVLPDPQGEEDNDLPVLYSQQRHRGNSHGPDSDVISYSSSDTVASQSSEGSRLVKSLMRDGPKAAWSDGIEMQSLIHRSLNSQESNRRDDMAFDNSSFSVELDDNSEKLLGNLNEKISEMSEVLDNWKTTRSAVERNLRQARHDVERRKKVVKEAILKYVQSLNDDLAANSQVNFDEIDKFVEEIDNRLHRMKKLRDSYSSLRSKEHVRMLKECIREFEQELDGLKVSDNVKRYQFHTVAKQSEETLMEIIKKLLGTVMTSSTDSKTSLNDDDFDDALESTLDRFRGRNLNDCLLDTPELVRTFTCRMKKDKRACGITDIAITDAGYCFVVDKHNKAVKIYDSKGCFDKYLGVGLLRKPSRVTFLPTRQEILVSDDATKTVHIFRSDGAHFRELKDLYFPVGHCQTADGGIAVIEFTTKSIALCNKEGNIEKSFETRLDCPAYIACTSSGRLVVSDWKMGCVRMFEPQGKELHTWSINSSEQSIQPYGICCDGFGNILVADRTGKAVVCLHEEGDMLKEYDDEKHKIGFPFALACCNSVDRSECKLVVAEYSGAVKIFNYLEPSATVPTSASNC